MNVSNFKLAGLTLISIYHYYTVGDFSKLAEIVYYHIL